MTSSSTMTGQSADDTRFRAALEARLYNRRTPSRTPGAVVRPTSEAEVVEAVRRARRDGLRIAVQSGGANWSSVSLREGGLLIDVGALDHVRIDTAARTATVGPGVRSQDFAARLAAVSLAFPVGHCGVPAMGGYLLGGGLGLNWGHWQPACFSVIAARVVTAAGELVEVDEHRNADLLWLLRGAGAGFPGIVTEFTVVLQNRPRDTRVSTWWFGLDRIDEVTRWVTKASATLPSHVEVAVTTAGPTRDVLPPGDGVPEHLVSVAALAFVDDAEDALRSLAPLDHPPLPPLLHTDREAVPFELLHHGAEVAHPAGHRVASDTFWSDHAVHEVLPPLADLLARPPSGLNSVVVLMPGHGAPGTNQPLGVSAYSMDKRTLVLAFATWTDAADDTPNDTWLQEVVARLEPLACGHFLNEADTSKPDRHRRSFSPENWARLRALTAAHDPDGVFHGFGHDHGPR